MPRIMPLDDLVALLVSEHASIIKGLHDFKDALVVRDYSHAKGILDTLDKLLREHIADEEAQVLKVLIEAYGVKGADDAIKVFRQHRPIYQLMEAVSRFSEMPAGELSRNKAALDTLFEEHTRAEETRIFPWALSTKNAKTD